MGGTRNIIIWWKEIANLDVTDAYMIMASLQKVTSKEESSNFHFYLFIQIEINTGRRKDLLAMIK